MKYEDRIDDFLSGRLQGDELHAFDKALKEDKALMKALAFRAQMLDTIYEVEKENRIARIEAHIAKRNRRTRLLLGLTVLSVLLLGLMVLTRQDTSEQESTNIQIENRQELSDISEQENEVIDSLQNEVTNTANSEHESDIDISETQEEKKEVDTRQIELEKITNETSIVEDTIEKIINTTNDTEKDTTSLKHIATNEKTNLSSDALAMIYNEAQDVDWTVGRTMGNTEENYRRLFRTGENYRQLVDELSAIPDAERTDVMRFLLALSLIKTNKDYASAKPLLETVKDGFSNYYEKAEWFYLLCVLSEQNPESTQNSIKRLREMVAEKHSQARRAAALLEQID